MIYVFYFSSHHPNLWELVITSRLTIQERPHLEAQQHIENQELNSRPCLTR